MAYRKAKVYTDGSHYIAIPHTERRTKYRPKLKEEEITVPIQDIPKDEAQRQDIDDKPMPYPAPQDVPQKEREDSATTTRTMTRKEYFDELYQVSVGLPKDEQRERIVEKMKPYIKQGEDAELYVEENIARKKRNLYSRRVRLMRKAYMNEFNYFCTFTYSDELHTEESFKRKLRTCLRHLTERKGWQYIAVWERSPTLHRLHLHGLFYVPDGMMIGNFEEKRDYSTTAHKMQITMQNDYFKSRFGRNDFEKLDAMRMGETLQYIVKYMEKTGEKVFASKGLPQFVISDILEDDVVCRYGLEDKKLLLFDDFTLIDDGCVIGQASKANLKKMPTE